MRALAALLVLLVATPVQAESSNAQVLLQAFDSESEQAVCDRAYRQASDRVTADMVDRARALKTFHQVLDDYRFAGLDRDALNKDLTLALQENGQWTEVQRVWSGRSCLVQLLLEVELGSQLDALASALPPRPDGKAGGGGWWDSIPGLSQFRNSSALGSALAELMPVKTYVAESWFSRGRFPDSLSEIGIDAGEYHNSEIIERVVMQSGGEIHAVLKGDLGGEWIILAPSEGPMGALNWRCTTSVATAMTGCEGP